MNKDFSQKMLLSMDTEKQIKVLHTLATFIEQGQFQTDSNHFKKLQKYHEFLDHSENELIQKLNKEFHKVKAIDYQFEVYLMNLERLLGQSKKEYEFLIKTKDTTTKTHSKHSIICVLDSIRSAHNVGAMIRNAECFNIESVILTGLSPKSEHPQVIKTAMGCEKLVSTQYYKDPLPYIKSMKEKGYKVWAVETAKEAFLLNELSSRPEKLILLFGHEHFGLSLELVKESEKVVEIPLFGHKNSLNVAVSQAITLHNLVNLKIES